MSPFGRITLQDKTKLNPVARRSRRRQVIMTTCGLAVVATLTACGSSHTTSSGTSTTPLSDPTSVASTTKDALPTTATTPPTAASPDTQLAGSFIAQDSAGNQANVGISLGTIQPASQFSDPLIQTCSSALSGIGSSLDRSLAVPITVQLSIISNQASSVSLKLADDYLVEQGGVPDTATSSLIFFAKGYASGTSCGNLPQDSAEAATITWNNLAPGTPQTWHGYIIQANAITPNDPDGTSAQLHQLLISPDTFLSDPQADEPGYVRSQSPNLVTCQQVAGLGGSRPFLAIDPATATGKGCKIT